MAAGSVISIAQNKFWVKSDAPIRLRFKARNETYTKRSCSLLRHTRSLPLPSRFVYSVWNLSILFLIFVIESETRFDFYYSILIYIYYKLIIWNVKYNWFIFQFSSMKLKTCGIVRDCFVQKAFTEIWYPVSASVGEPVGLTYPTGSILGPSFHF